MSLPPFPRHDAMTMADRRVTSSWWQWFSELVASWARLELDVIGASSNITALQTTTLQNTIAIAQLSQAGETLPFDAAHFVGGDPMTWHVDASDVRCDRWLRVGRLVAWTFDYAGTDLGGLMSTTVLRTLPSGIVAAAAQRGTYALIDGASSVAFGYWSIDAQSNVLQFQKGYPAPSIDPPIFSGPTASLFGQIVLEVEDV